MLFILNKSHEVVGTLNSDGDLSKIVTYFDDEYVQDLGTGAETFQFSTMANTEQAQHLVAGNFVAFKEDGEFKLFSIIQIEETHEETFIKTVYCEMAGIELINEVIRPVKILNSSLRKFLTTILADTEWQLGKIDAGFTQVYDFEITDYKTVYELIQEYAVGTYGAEISYRVEIEHGRITGKYIDCYAERGKSEGFRFAYGSNLTSVVRTVDMSNLATALIGIGKNNLTFKEVETGDKPLNQDFIVNQTAFEQWNINGNHIFGIHKEDTDSPQELLRLTRLALEERANPQIKYEMKAELLGRDIKIGDTVNVIDHEFNPPLYLSARVNQLTRSKTNPYDDEVVLANFKEVKSNITAEMRQLASQLEGYVDSQFPIGGDKIQNGAIGKEQFSKQYHTEIVSDAVYASLVETEELIAGKADIGELHAVNATIENLKAENVVITGKLEVTDAEIENLKAENVEINGSLTANSASIKDLYANKASVEELYATKADIESIVAKKIDVEQLNATKAEIEQLVATKADIESLNAFHGKIEILESTKANISDLNATNAQIDSLKANKADIVELNAVKGSITQLESEVAEIGTLKSDVADIEHILAGNITADNIASGTITAGSGIIADGAIGSAQISDLDASKISAGKIDTSKVEVAGTNSHLRIKGNRLQVFQGTGNQAKERVSLGDVNGDGTIYGLRVRGADGQTVLLDENGVTSEGITDGSIDNSKISDDANIDGSKLNINSVVSKINEDGTETIQGTKIEVDGTTLNTKLSTITNKQTEDSNRITQAQSQITANTNAIKLKVDEQTYATDKKGTETALNKHTSEINALKDEISLKVDKTGVEQIVDEVTGELIDSKIDTAKAEIKVTTDAISQNVSNLTQTVSNKADSSTVTTINNKVGSLETSVNGISGKVTNLEKTTTDLGTSVKGVQGEVSTLKSDVASLEVTTSGISQKVSSVESTTTTLTQQMNQVDDKIDTVVNNVQIGGRNYVLDSNRYITGNTNHQFLFALEDIQKLRGQKVVVSIEVDLNKAIGTRVGFEPSIKFTDGTIQYLSIWQSISSATTMKKRISATYTIEDKEISSFGQRGMYIQGVTSGIAKIGQPKLEFGTKATDYSQAPEDVDDAITNVDGKVNTLQGEYNTTKSKVATLETNLDGITQRVSSTETTTATLTTQMGAVDGKINTAINNEMTTIGQANSFKTSKKTISTTGWYRVASNSGNRANARFILKDVTSGKHMTATVDAGIHYGKNPKLILQNLSYYGSTSISKARIVYKSTYDAPYFEIYVDANSTIEVWCLDNIQDTGWTKVDLVEGSIPTGYTTEELVINMNNVVNTKIETTKSQVSEIKTDLSGITSRVSNVETKQSTTEGKVSSLETRVSSAEQKITDSAIISTVTSTIENKVNQGINNISLGGTNLFINSDFNKTITSSGNTDKHQNLYPSSWGGYNSGIANPTTSYHAHIDNNTFPYNVVEYNESDGTRNWKGITQLINVDLLSDSNYVISVDAHATLNGAKLFGGFYYTKKGTTTTNFHSGQFTITNFSTQGFTRVSSVVPLNYNDIDLTKNVSFYIYGYGFSSNSILYIKNVKLEKGNKATDWTPSQEDVESSLAETEKTLNANIDNAVGTAKEDVLKNVSENYSTKGEVTSLSESFNSKLEQTSKDITATFTTAQSYTKEVDGKLQEFKDTVGTHIRFSANGIDLGKTDSPFTATLDNTQLAFKQDGQTVAYISNNKMYITQAEIKDSLRLGNTTNGFFTWIYGSSGNMSLKWSDK